MKSVTLYTDGACSGNPGPGGWAAILLWRGKEKVLSGGEELTTNNRMELTAVIRGLEALKEPCLVTVYSDSRYVVEAMTEGWALGWRARGWKRRGSGEPALGLGQGPCRRRAECPLRRPGRGGKPEISVNFRGNFLFGLVKLDSIWYIYHTQPK